jgi:hypothetical protein
LQRLIENVDSASAKPVTQLPLFQDRLPLYTPHSFSPSLPRWERGKMGGVRGRGSPTIFFSFLDVIVEMFLSKTKRNKKEKVGDLYRS